MRKQKVLFICVHNSARSQMAAALLNETCGEFFEGESAGLEPGTISPLAVSLSSSGSMTRKSSSGSSRTSSVRGSGSSTTRR